MSNINTQTGLRKETTAALSYLLGPLTGILFLLLEKDDFIRFHAMQSIVIFVIAFSLNLTASIVLNFLVPLLWLLEIVLWLTLMYKASLGQKWEVPIIGTFTRQFIKS